jgi:3-oxoacyl-[acyl-carrier protein] reductase
MANESFFSLQGQVAVVTGAGQGIGEGIAARLGQAGARMAILDTIAKETIQYMVSRIPMGRIGTIEEIAALVHFLVSREASFTTGQCYDISGGRATY